MPAPATAERSPVEELPIALALAVPEPYDLSPFDTLAHEQTAASALYDPIEQVSRGSDIRMIGSRSPDFCSVTIQGADMQAPDSVRDD